MGRLEGKEVIPIDNNEYKNKEIDEIIQKIESFNPKFIKLQNELDEIFKEYDSNSQITKQNIHKINETIKYITTLENNYELDSSVKDIIINHQNMPYLYHAIELINAVFLVS